MTDILVLVEHEDGTPKKVSNQILTAAKQIGDGSVAAAIFGAGAAAAADKVGEFGATTAYVWEGAEADEYATEPKVAALVAAIEASGADAVLYAADPFVTDVVARCAVRTGSGVVADAVDLELDGDRIVASKAIFGGDMNSMCQVTGDGAQFIGVKPNSFQAESAGGGAAEVVELSVDLPESATRAKITDVVEAAASGRPEMTEAAIIVSGGRGLGEEEGFELIGELADALGGAVGASRAATDAGWIAHSHQIGQTGKTVSPQLYLANGISGAIQHRAGMQTAQTIAVINKDAEAPIFSIADIGIVGDLYKVIPPLVEEINKRKG
ncbi:electron transfer flavoprotein subunit alpha/FixB family protein [Euzebya tangerina]|uniref:electron transfer flavoprotein subunit alpha/FixB family protein n=1 Tax=Euzebya tangerina TaxID=591198 RepID=UPI000E311A23|nr:electron transfer flavoprotein subunit alpha/FixB family protein [Euzebya tangerina]